MTLSVQFLTLIAMVSSGFYLGIIQETFRRFTPYWKNSKLLTYFLEISFWLTQTAIIFYVLFLVNAGEIRLYVFLACLLGFSIYQVFAKTIYRRILEGIIKVLTAIYRFFRNVIHAVIITPITWIIRLFVRLILLIITLLVTIVFFILRVVFTPFRWIGKGIYYFLPDSFKNFLHKIAGFYSTIKNICYKWVKYLKFKRR
ncbi:spore cortex biosynthesis protein YabQ [Oceanobacillus saliphilus]|uniref:spore cortex biosynthesis protein YabQ n=1 Tax=Oceanobacillus saliphilus TaxID=2925834 RepID=UPI0027D2B390|nr:spore cortex biosynthesis protein YabQ [Oceanobacillus saliphilus]